MKAGDYMVQTTIRIPKKLHMKLKEEAKQKGLTFNALVIVKIDARKEKESVGD